MEDISEFTQQELDNALEIMVEHLQKERKQTLNIITRDASAKRAIPTLMLELKNETIKIDDQKIIAAYIEEAYKKACEWINESELTETFKDKKLKWMVCCEGLHDVAYCKTPKSRLPRGLRFYQPQWDEFFSYYLHIKGEKNQENARKEEAVKFMKVFLEKIKIKLAGLGNYFYRSHDREGYEFEQYGHGGIYVLFHNINYAKIKAQYGKEEEIKEETEEVKPTSRQLFLHYTPSTQEAIPSAPKIQEEKFDAWQLANACFMLAELIDLNIEKYPDLTIQQLEFAGKLEIKSEESPQRIIVNISFMGKALPSILHMPLEGLNNERVAIQTTLINVSPEGRLNYALSVSDISILKHFSQAAMQRVMHWLNSVDYLNLSMSLMGERIDWIAGDKDIRLYQPSAEKYAHKYDTPEARKKDVFRLFNEVWRKMGLAGMFPLKNRSEINLPSQAGKIIVDYHSKEHPDYVSFGSSGRYIAFTEFFIGALEKAAGKKLFPGNEVNAVLIEESASPQNTLKVREGCHSQREPSPVLTKRSASLTVLDEIPAAQPLPSFSDETSSFFSKRQRRDEAFLTPTDAQASQSLYDSPRGQKR